MVRFEARIQELVETIPDLAMLVHGLAVCALLVGLAPGPAESPSVDYYASAFTYYPGRPEIRTLMCLVYDRSVDVQIMRLRRKIEPDPAQPKYIRTERGAGYLFGVPVDTVY